MKAKEFITEKVEKILINDQPVLIYINPTVDCLLEQTKRKTMRGLINTNGEMFWWSASNAIHIQIANSLGLTHDLNDIYKPNGISRLDMKGTGIKIISGYLTADNSPQFQYLMQRGIKIIINKKLISFDQYKNIINMG
jgi:hypothetical protein